MKKTAIVTGTSGGIGAAIVKKLLINNWHVIGTSYKHKHSLQSFLSDHVEKKNCFYTNQFDITSEKAVSTFYAKYASFLEGSDELALVNCAGLSHYGLFQDTSIDQWNQLMSVNITGTFLMCKHIMNYMIRKRKGVVLNLSSIWGAKGASCEVAYSATKGAIDALTKALAQEVAPSGIRVNALAPGVVDTEMFRQLSLNDQEETLESIPLKRAATVEEISEYALFLVSEKSAYLTGQIVTVAGGFAM